MAGAARALWQPASTKAGAKIADYRPTGERGPSFPRSITMTGFSADGGVATRIAYEIETLEIDQPIEVSVSSIPPEGVGRVLEGKGEGPGDWLVLEISAVTELTAEHGILWDAPSVHPGRLGAGRLGPGPLLRLGNGRRGLRTAAAELRRNRVESGVRRAGRRADPKGAGRAGAGRGRPSDSRSRTGADRRSALAPSEPSAVTMTATQAESTR